ncbi:hemolysin activation/secretion protein [Burkholderia sp. b13]|nr:hemolysin activation/secretion protein [Burkholderia sp. b13]
MPTSTARLPPRYAGPLVGCAALLLGGIGTSPGALAQNPPEPTRQTTYPEQRLEQQRQAQEREQAINTPAVRSSAPPAAAYPVLPIEQPCFRLDRLALKVPELLPASVRAQGASALPQDRFAFARQWLAHYAGQCVGKQGLDRLVSGLTQEILSRGYITTRVMLAEQDLSHGELTVTLVPGVIHTVRFSEPTIRGTWKSAFPARAGDALNLRDLEQGLEQLKRVPSQDVDMRIEPAQTPGQSDVVIQLRRAKPWTIVAAVDNSGARATGKLQGHVSVGVDNPLGLNDILNVGANHDLSFSDKRLGSHGWNAAYSIPYGYWTASLSASTNTYYQQIVGVNHTFVASGNSQFVDARVHRTLARSQAGVFGVQLRGIKRFGASFIEDTEIKPQRRNNTFIELGLTHRHYVGGAQFDGLLAYRHGLGWLGATPALPRGYPTYRLRMASLDANLSVPFTLASQPLRYVSAAHGQFTNDRLFYLDSLTIGSRYTVRGFDGETMLAGERGFYWRNELQAPIAHTGQHAYAALDYGQVFGPLTRGQDGTRLVGTALGLRGTVPTRLATYTYELFAGTPLYRPTALSTARVTVGFQLSVQL